MFARFALLALCTALAAAGLTTPPLGAVLAGIGVWEERSQLVWLNVARQGPVGFRAEYLPPATGNALATATAPLAPLYPSFDLSRAARAHSYDMQETPCTVRGTDCNGTSSFVRIGSFYPDGITEEAVLQVSTTQNQYLHTPRHFVRILICGGGFDTIDQWPLFNCPDDAQAAADSRLAMMDPSALRVGVGFRCRLGQIGTGCSVTHDYTNMPVAPEYNNRIRSATHTFLGTLPEQKDSIRFIANYFNPLGAAPSNATVWFDGQVLQLTCDAAFGVPSNCAYRSPVVPVVAADTASSNCRLYFFEFFDGPAPGVRQRYPEDGAFYTFGEGRCWRDWIPQAEADVVIATRNAGLPFSPPFVPPPGQGNMPPADPFLITIIVSSIVVGIVLIIFVIVCIWTCNRKPRAKKVPDDHYIRLDEPRQQSSYTRDSHDSSHADRERVSGIVGPGVDYRFGDSSEEVQPIRASNQSSRQAALAAAVRPMSSRRPLPRAPSSRHDTGEFDPTQETLAPVGLAGTTTMNVSTAGWGHQSFTDTPAAGSHFHNKSTGMGMTTMDALISEVPRPFRVLYAYSPSTLGELPVRQGEVVFILPGDEQHPGGWAYVENEKGATGYIPAGYVTQLENN